MKKINRKKLIEFLKEKTNLQHTSQQSFCGKNMFFLDSVSGTETNNEFQLEFIPQNDRYFFTIYLRGIRGRADHLHEELAAYVRGLNLGRNVIVDTETISTLI